MLRYTIKIDNVFFVILAIVCEPGNILFKGKKDRKMVLKIPVENGSTRKFGYCKIVIGFWKMVVLKILALENGTTHCCHSKSYKCNI